MDQDLRTGREGVEIKIGFQVDRLDETRQEGWSVLIQGPAHHVPEDEVAKAAEAGVTPWAGGETASSRTRSLAAACQASDW
ncbi:pyridoxamine 5'-phosphate oxidase family protein [Nonomuraea turcica]|uniref:pyridoxamine 5'-phosphate oxidase family protein n=1 Tax=Nonomuraea sp. G32 TaxID=3067274 RepID=UPI00273AF0FA|nr:pyridoxamine 5'-phosphate oxidase family protein [Nonomuraea sp. G32]MDP4511364.1 pyridoxamine 5'-phosphate oxidase family protein [Nonomuraea sp. G32]